MSKIIEIYKFSKHSVSTGKIVSVSDPRSWWAEISNQTFEIFMRYTSFIYICDLYKENFMFRKNHLASAGI